MEKKSNKVPEDDHHLPPAADDTTRKKIDKHLSDIDDTISEDDIKNINTDIGTDTGAISNEHLHDIDEADEIMKDQPDDEPEKEAPSSWEILGD
jgi:hypothetical protein